jgi:hypothetical protein
MEYPQGVLEDQFNIPNGIRASLSQLADKCKGWAAHFLLVARVRIPGSRSAEMQRDLQSQGG